MKEFQVPASTKFGSSFFQPHRWFLWVQNFSRANEYRCENRKKKQRKWLSLPYMSGMNKDIDLLRSCFGEETMNMVTVSATNLQHCTSPVYISTAKVWKSWLHWKKNCDQNAAEFHHILQRTLPRRKNQPMH